MASQQTHLPLANPTPYQLRSLVLDYLCHNCYTNTARVFARDSTVRHLDADGDEIDSKQNDLAELSTGFLRHVDIREKIRAHILSGRVDDATELLNEHFPSVLSGPISGPTPTASSNDTKPSSSMDYVASTSVDAAHLTLNLRILSFIEACRTVPLEYPSTTDTTRHSQLASDIPSNPIEAQMALLSKAQKLHVLANALPKASDRAIYLKELNNVGGLLAYKVPETSSIAKYLSQERREAVADQINSAILDRSALPSVSSLELMTRYTSTIWSFAHQHGVNARPGSLLPPTIGTSAESLTKSPSSEPEVVPPFDLQLFLNLKPN